MNLRKWVALSLALVAVAVASAAPPKVRHFRFAAIGQPAARDDATLERVLRQLASRKISFSVINGIRPSGEGCSDAVFQRRVRLMSEAERPVVLSLAARDWAECRNEKGESVAQERLGFLRGTLFDPGHGQRTKRLPLTRQSSDVKFRSYPENVRWEQEGVLFATINLPSSNNHYLTEAGRNHEFEDRLVANRQWLQRIFAHAKSRRKKSIVLFVDGNPLALPPRSAQAGRRDGFLEVRKQLLALAARFPGKVLLVHGQPSSGNIVWRDNVGTVGSGRFALELTVRQGTAVLFTARKLNG